MQGLDLIKLTSIGAILHKKARDLHLRSKVLVSSLALVLACIVRDLHIRQWWDHILVQDDPQSQAREQLGPQYLYTHDAENEDVLGDERR